MRVAKSTDTAISSATAASSSDKAAYQTSDRQGSAALLIASNGLVMENNRTLPYGELWCAPVASATTTKFTTYERDQESNLDYAMNRYMSNSYGRFMSSDKGGVMPASPGTLNRYLYVSNDPVNKTDPDGNMTQCEGGLVYDLQLQSCMPRPPDASNGPGPGCWELAPGGCDGGEDGGGGGTPTRDPRLDKWDSLSKDCQNGLTGAMKGSGDAAIISRVNALNRAQANMGALTAATAGTLIDAAMVAAIGIRETGFRHLQQGPGGNRGGVGVFQIDLIQNPSVSFQTAWDTTAAAGWVVQRLSANMASLSGNFPGLDAATLGQALASSYNHGLGRVTANLNSGVSPDLNSKGVDNHYGSNVMNLKSCFNQ